MTPAPFPGPIDARHPGPAHGGASACPRCKSARRSDPATGHVRQPLVDELLSRTVGLHMHQDAIGRLSLTAVARHRVAVVEMALIAAIQGDRPARVEAHPYVAG